MKKRMGGGRMPGLPRGTEEVSMTKDGERIGKSDKTTVTCQLKEKWWS